MARRKCKIIGKTLQNPFELSFHLKLFLQSLKTLNSHCYHVTFLIGKILQNPLEHSFDLKLFLQNLKTLNSYC
jgi:hypothetical protein